MERRVASFFGRAYERELLDAVVDGARSARSGAIVIRGEPGIGKSTLIEAIVDGANDFQILRAIGVESESELAFAGVHQLVWPLLDRVDELPQAQAVALRAALGLDEARAVDDRFLVGAAVLSLLACAADTCPLLCIVDDAHWLDGASTDALTFAARRLVAEPIALIFAAREGDIRSFEAPGLPDLHLHGLDSESAAGLLAERSEARLAPDAAARLMASANGNPLALIELPLVLGHDRVDGPARVGDHVPVGRTMETVFLKRVRALPPTCQTLALVAAADDTGDVGVVLRAAMNLGLEPEVLDELERSGLLSTSQGQIVFRHPLVRSAIYQGSTFGERREAHEALSAAMADERYVDRRVWHRAAATVGTDEELAAELERSAGRALARSGHAAASAAFERAAGFTAVERERARLLAAAAWAGWLGGRKDAALAALESGRHLSSEPETAADLAHLAALIEVQRGSPARAHEILIAAVDEIAVDPSRAAAMLVQAGEAANFAGDVAGEIDAGKRADALRRDHGVDQFELTMMSGVAKLLDDDSREGAALLGQAAAQAAASDNPRRFSWAGSCAFYLGNFEQARTNWQRFADESRSAGAVSLLAVALAYQAYIDALAGHFGAASANASEGLALARETGQDNAATFHESILALITARSGSEDACRRQAADVFKAADVHGLGIQAGNANLALGELELALGRPEQALGHLEAVWNGPAGTTSVSVQLLGVPDLVEAAARSGRPERAERALSRWEAWVSAIGSPYQGALVARSRALLASGEEALDGYREALERHAAAPGSFESARTELLYGEALRRARHPKQARDHLRAALETFEQIGADPWSERARSELRASGETARKRDPSLVDELTSQELQIARLVAGGASNKEVAAQLFLSPRTVEFHLRHVYAKLGISSRGQLAAAALDT